MPHPTTLMKLTTRCGETAVAGLNEALRAKAAGQKLLRTARLRLGPHSPGPQAGGSDLVRARGIHPQPSQDRDPGQLTRHSPAAARHPDRTYTYYDDFFRAK